MTPGPYGIPIDRARDDIAAQIEADHPPWKVSHGIFGWKATRPGYDDLVAQSHPELRMRLHRPVSSWAVDVESEAIALRLVSGRGPLPYDLPGRLTWLRDGWLRADAAALTSLGMVGRHVDGWVTWDGDTPVMHIGEDQHRFLPYNAATMFAYGLGDAPAVTASPAEEDTG